MVANNFKVGGIFSDCFLDYLYYSNQTSSHKVYEIYGSTNELSYLTARPSYRLPNITRAEFEYFIKKANLYKIPFNYTLNASHIGTKSDIHSRKKEIKEFIRYLISIGIMKFTVTLPIIAQIIREVDEKVFIEVSTIAELTSVSQIKLWSEKYNIAAMCLPLSKNRDIRFIKAASDYCKKNNIILDLMVNEFCSNGINDEKCSTSSCIYRNHCYDLHSSGYTIEDSKKIDDYPLAQCQASRNNPLIWLKSNFIRPEDLQLYNSVGINHFKITGRTADLCYMIKLIESYRNQYREGSVITLWKDISTLIGREENQISLDNRELDGFVAYWFSPPPT